jgi:hypothetical protein
MMMMISSDVCAICNGFAKCNGFALVTSVWFWCHVALGRRVVVTSGTVEKVRPKIMPAYFDQQEIIPTRPNSRHRQSKSLAFPRIKPVRRLDDTLMTRQLECRVLWKIITRAGSLIRDTSALSSLVTVK